MDKKEKEERLENHEKYWNLVDKINDISLDAIDDLSVSDVISVLDRVKVTLMQQGVLMEVEQTQKQNEVEEEDGSEVESEITPPQAELKVESPFVNPIELIEQMDKGRVNN